MKYVNSLSAIPCAMLLTLSSFEVSALSVGISVSDLGNPYFFQLAKGAEEKVKELVTSSVDVDVVSSAYDVDRQVGQIQRFIDDEKDLILLSAASFEGLEPVVNAAKAEGIKVIAVDVRAKGADATVTTDNIQAGELACHDLANRLYRKGTIAIITGPPVSSIIDRVDGCKGALAEYPNIELIPHSFDSAASEEGGLDAMTNLLAAYPHVVGVFAINDPAAIGAVRAAKQARREDVIFVAVDGAPVAVNALKSKNSAFKSTAAQFPRLLGARAIKVGYSLMQGEVLDQRLYLVPAELITEETVGTYKNWEAHK